MPAKVYKVTMSAEERSVLHRLVSTGKVAAYKRVRAQILLKADQSPGQPGWGDRPISEAFEVGRVTVERTRKTFVLEGLDAALSRKKQDRPSNLKFDGQKEAQLIALRCSAPPEGRERWTLQLLADQLVELEIFERISPETVRDRLKKFLHSGNCYPDKVHQRLFADFFCSHGNLCVVCAGDTFGQPQRRRRHIGRDNGRHGAHPPSQLR